MAEIKPRRVKAQPIPTAGGGKTSNRQLWARVCFFYPQYTLKEASMLSVRDLKLLLNTAKKIEAERKYDLVQIAAAPHTKKGSGVKKLTEHYRKEMN